jgi:exodeoxyribonuclease V alpha subunit
MVLQHALNPPRPSEPAAERFGWRFQVRDKVIQTENNYKKEVFNGDIGAIERIDPVDKEVFIRYDDRLVTYDYGELDEISLAYAITIHKSQGSEFPAVVIPVAMQHFMLLERNLIYTGITRARKFLVVVGQKKALSLAVRNDQSRKRYSGLLSSLKEAARPVIDRSGSLENPVCPLTERSVQRSASVCAMLNANSKRPNGNLPGLNAASCTGPESSPT